MILRLKTGDLTSDPAIYRTPSFSPDGNTVVYRKEGGNGHQGYTYSLNSGLYIVPVKGGTAEFITAEGENHNIRQMEIQFISLQVVFFLVQ